MSIENPDRQSLEPRRGDIRKTFHLLVRFMVSKYSKIYHK